MKLIKQTIDARLQSGSVTLLPTTPEDMWSAYNLLHPSDQLRASAIRRVTTTSSSTGSTSSTRVHTTLTLSITSLDFDARASQLHVSGRVCAENAHARLGAHHTLDLELHRNFTLTKPDGGWDSVALRTLRDAVRAPADSPAAVWALLLDEGAATLCVVAEGTTVLRATIASRLGDKGSAGHAAAVQRFYKKTLDALLRALDFSQELRPVLVAGVGFAGAGFVAHVRAAAAGAGAKGKGAAEARELRALLDKIVLEKTASAGVGALGGVLASPGVQKRLADTKWARETALLDRVFERMRTAEARVAYGPAEVERAVEAGGVGRGGGVLLISDELFRSVEIGVRKRWVALVDRVRDREGGEVRVLSSLHESGRRLRGVGDIAALLTFPLYEEDEDDGEAAAPVEREEESRHGDEALPEIEM